ncbi:PREDICTED: uncharacterized protein LOC106747671 [Dinoponera quadriceps]|uniref:Uncharacterized protein LOC106747671 n=1 Tax=Dinoponera quadriceps TaxID=609295 RepID=A0A6P3XRP8_DINQU|nr:PREDICTED: uncharacterized protein LOC106747671 [Dinoponera quadriceps]
MSNPNIQVFKYHGPYTVEYYNQFFNPNTCHVCKTVDRGDLILCDRCSLISYCSEKHKIEHHTEHEEICTIITRLGLQKDTRNYSNWQQWIESRNEFMAAIQQNFHRPMKSYEKQMILWSKSCVVCHQQTRLQTCQKCFSANYCDAHAGAFTKKHDADKCERLMRLLNIDIEIISGNTTGISYAFLESVNEKKHFAEMLEFCVDYVLISRKDVNWLAKDYILSDHLSGPLTIYSGFKRNNILFFLKKSKIVIHIVAATTVDKDSLPAWEILLHLIPKLTELVIFVVGPDLTYYSDKHKLCKLCSDSKKSFSFTVISMLYHDYASSPEHYIRPNLIVGFHAEFNMSNIWSKSIKVMVELCPILLTSSEKDAGNSLEEMKDILSTNIEPIFNGKNYFAGLAPHRDIETGDTYFRNEHLTLLSELICDNDTSDDTISISE